MLRRLGAAVAVAIGLVLAGTASVVPAAAGLEEVAIRNYAFSPGTLTVMPGTTVTWTNYDLAPHTVTEVSGPAPLSSPELARGQSWSYTFERPGTYRYYCAVHPSMLGTVVVPELSSRTEMALSPTASGARASVPSTTASTGVVPVHQPPAVAVGARAEKTASDPAAPSAMDEARPFLVLAGVAVGVAGLATLAVRGRPN